MDNLKFLAKKVVTSEHVDEATFTKFKEAEEKAYSILKNHLTEEELTSLTKEVVVIYDITKPMYYNLVQGIDRDGSAHYMLGYNPSEDDSILTEILKNALMVYLYDKVMESDNSLVEKLSKELGISLPKDSVNYSIQLKLNYTKQVVKELILGSTASDTSDTRDYTTYLKLQEV